MHEHQVYEALKIYLQAAVAASVAPPSQLERCEAEVHEAQLRYHNALEAFHLRLRARKTRDLPPVVRARVDD